MTVETERLIIKPNNFDEMRALLERETDAEMRQAYGEMIDCMRLIPERFEWACEWSIMLKSNNAVVGGIGFKGVADENGTVEIGYGINEEYRRQGIATQAVAAMSAWALAQPEVKCVAAQTEEGNGISQRVLLANGFVRDGCGDEGPLFKKYDEER